MDFGSFTNSGKMSGGAGGSAGDVYSTNTYNTTTSSGFNSSGWTVATGNSKASATAGGMSPLTMGLIAAACLVGLWIYKRK